MEVSVGSVLEVLNSDDLVRTAGVSYRKVDYWARRGYLQPLPGPGGSGHGRRWTTHERDVAAMMGRLTAAGMAPVVAHAVARAGGDHEVAPGIRVVIVTPPAEPVDGGGVDGGCRCEHDGPCACTCCEPAG